jgi:hypothetical protein
VIAKAARPEPAPRRKVRVLVFPCGSENAGEIHDALQHSIHVELFGASSIDDHGRFRFARYQGGLPLISNPGFDRAFGELVAREGIDMVFPTHDTVAEYLAPRAEALGFHLVNGDVETTRVARRKSLTYDLFADRHWAPRRHSSVETIDAWPVVVKPDLGQGGQSVTVARNADEARAAVARTAEPLIVEYLPGDEATIDCFTDRKGRLVWAGPRTRERIRAGIAMRSRYLDGDATLATVAEEINARLVLRGPWFFQMKRDMAGAWKLLEVSCRVAGAMVAQRARGVNLPLLAVQDFLGRDVMALPEARVRMVDRAIATRVELDHEFDTVYVDLDDTLVIDSHAVPHAIAFLYQMAAEGKEIVLVTRHEADIERTLARARIAPALFDRIVHVTDGGSKARHVAGRAIFIDNHFPERLDVSRATGVPVLDVDALQFLLK